MALRALTIIALLFFAVTGPLFAQDRQALEKKFSGWLENAVWPEARKAGVSRGHFVTAMSGVKIDWKLPGIDLPSDKPRGQKQSEFTSPGRYFRAKTIEGIERIGKQMARRHSKTLADVEKRTGVPGRIVLAIWGRESGFGNVGDNYNAYEVLATRGFFGPNADYFTGELIAALTIAGNGNRLKSSWAGALGQPQMMPTSYLAYGADGDGDDRIDIWNSQADTIASIAQFLADHEWVGGRDWGFEINLPNSVSCALEGPDLARPIREWVKMGITRISGRPFPENELNQPGSILLPAGRNGPAFIVTPNFYVLKRYNRSDVYALFIGNTGDRIQYGMGNFRAAWKAVNNLTRSDVAAMQSALEALGHDTGGADGIAGYKTRRSIGRWQQGQNRPATCFPDANLKAVLTR